MSASAPPALPPGRSPGRPRPLALSFAALLVFGLVLAPAVPAQAGAWTKAWGEYYVKAGADFYAGFSYVDPETGEESDVDFFGQQYSVYVEAGVLPVWPIQVGLSVPFSIGSINFVDDTFPDGAVGKATTRRFGDLRLSVQGAILKKGFQLNAALDVKLPMYSNDDVGETFVGWEAAFPLPGDGQVDLTPNVVLGGAIPGLPVDLWVEGSVGYRIRTEAFVGWDTDTVFVDGIPFWASVGFGKAGIYAITRVDGIKNIKEDLVTREAVTLGFSIFGTVWRGLAIEGRLAADVYAKNAAQGISFGGGLSWRIPHMGYVPRKDRKAGIGEAG